MGWKAIDAGRLKTPGMEVVNGRLVHSIVAWFEALNGSAPLDEALGALLSAFRAEAGMIVRTHLAEMRPVVLAVAEAGRTSAAARPLTTSYADGYFGEVLASARAGTIWIASSHAEDATGNPALGHFQASRRMREFVVLVLSNQGRTRDHVEVHFREPLTREAELAFAAVMPDMARVWAGRQVGLMARRMDNQRGESARKQRLALRQPILSTENPAQLSRAEFRVCLLLSRGLVVQAVARELSLSEPTIRTHLRNIYAKTECGSLAELVFRLLDGRPDDRHQALSA